MKRVLLKRGKLVFALFMLFLSCSKSHKDDKDSNFKTFISDNFHIYNDIYKIINDSIISLINDSIYESKYFRLSKFQIDSCIIFNNDSTRLFTTLNKSNQNWKDAIADNISELGGAKIHDKWYFFFGASMPIPREMFSDKLYEPLSFKRLSEIAHQQFHSKYLKIGADGNYIVNENLFNNYLCPLANGSWEDKPKSIVDSLIVIELTQKRQKKLDPAEIARIKAEMAASRKPLEPRRTWFGLGGPH